MEKVIYSKNRGRGMILDQHDDNLVYFTPKSVIVNGIQIKPGDMTTMSDFFPQNYKYVGVLKEDNTCMVFFMALESNLFDTHRYYTCWWKIAENRIFNMFSQIGGRDFNYINGQWK